MSNTERRIYVACLASYNSGRLHGVWIDTEGKDADELIDEVRERVLLISPYPNVFVTCPACHGRNTLIDLVAGISRQPGVTVSEPRRGWWQVRRDFDGYQYEAGVRRLAIRGFAKANGWYCHRCLGTGHVASAEEWAIHDHEGFGGLLGEYDPFERVAALDRSLGEHGDAFLAFLSAFGSDADPEKFGDAYRGSYSSEETFAQESAYDSGLVTDNSPLVYYIDWKHYWSSELRHGFIFENGHVFYCNC